MVIESNPKLQLIFYDKWNFIIIFFFKKNIKPNNNDKINE